MFFRGKDLSHLAWDAVIAGLAEVRTEFGHRRATVEEYRLGEESFAVLRGREDHGVRFDHQGGVTYHGKPVKLLDDGHDRAISAWSYTDDLVVEFVVGGTIAARKASDPEPEHRARPSAPTMIDVEKV